MTKPIGQTFFINEPTGGVEGVVLTKVDIYFQRVSNVYGIEMQIRQTDNGNPTPSILPNASCILKVDDTYADGAKWTTNNSLIAAGTKIIQASADASVPTTFEFPTPVFLQSQTPYAIMLIPIGGNPDYNVWVAELGATDVSSKAPIKTNNDTGTLFLSSNDLQYTAVQSEDIKFTIHTADFSTSGGSGTAVYVPYDEENVLINNISGNFIPNEFIYIGNTNFNIASINISSNTGTFTVGELVYQSNGSSNVATGNLVFANTSTIKISNTHGAWVNTDLWPIQGATSSSNATIASVSQNVISYSNTILTVPFTSDGAPGSNIFYSNQSLYLGTNTRSSMQVLLVNNVINSTAIQIKSSTTVKFSDTDCIFGQLVGDGLNTHGRYSGPDVNNIPASSVVTPIFLWDSTANSTTNFANTSRQFMIGSQSGASAKLVAPPRYLPYTAVIPQFATNNSKSINIDFSFVGRNQVTGSIDSTPNYLQNQTQREMQDVLRSLPSRTNEVTSYNSAYVTKFYADMTTANNKFSPYIDRVQQYATFTYNNAFRPGQVSGASVSIAGTRGSFVMGPLLGDAVKQTNGSGIISLAISANTGAFTEGETIFQADGSGTNNAVGTLWSANTTVIQVYQTTGLWTNNTVIQGSSSSSNATVTQALNTVVTGKVVLATPSQMWIGEVSGGVFKRGYPIQKISDTTIYTNAKQVSTFDEKFNYGNVFPNLSRYISKNVILADKQDAEDIACYLTAYRPATTDFQVYGKFLHADDPDAFDNKLWSRLPELSTSSALFSSTSNPDDFVELIYSLPTSKVLFTNSILCNTTSTSVTVDTTSSISNGQFVYIKDSSTNKFIVRQVFAVANNTTVVLYNAPSFESSNADIGIIPGLEDQTTAFHYADNNGVIRYVSNTDVVYDSYKIFAVKLVPVANQAYLVPRANDMRCLALQV